MSNLSDIGCHRELTVIEAGVVFLPLHDCFTSGAIADTRYGEFERRGLGMLEFARDIAAGWAA